MAVIKKNCIECHGLVAIQVEENDYLDWRFGKKFIQDAFPYLSPEKREMLISGMCAACFNKMFGDN